MGRTPDLWVSTSDLRLERLKAGEGHVLGQQGMGSYRPVHPPPVPNTAEWVQGLGPPRLTPGPSQCWAAWAKHCRPGLAAAQPRSLPTPQAGGTVPAARTAGSGFADVSEEAQGPGRVRPSPHPWDTAAPGLAGQRG